MTRLERRIHRLIEKAIVEHGYVLKTAKVDLLVVNHEQRTCCAVGAIRVGLNGEEAVNSLTREVCGIDTLGLLAMSAGFEGDGISDYQRPELHQIGRDIRKRYVVNT